MIAAPSSTVTAAQAAALMNVHTHTVFKLIDDGVLPAAKLGRGFVLLRKDVMNHIEKAIIAQTAARIGTPRAKRAYTRRSPQLVGQV